MGYDTTRFKTPVNPNLICGICSNVLEVPVLTPCGHTFCAECVTTWLSRSASTCPECRAWVEMDEVRPILSLRNFIHSMEVSCKYMSAGCKLVTTLDKHTIHQKNCRFAPVTCVGCEEEVSSIELAYHQMQCPGIQNLLESDDNETSATDDRPLSLHPSVTSRLRNNTEPDAISTVQVTRLQTRITSLEKRVSRLLDDLRESQVKNSLLYIKYKMAKDELYHKIKTVDLGPTKPALRGDADLLDFYNYNTSSQNDIARLSLIIARNLLRKPNYLDSDRIFKAITGCYQIHFLGSNDHSTDHDIHMLLATAYASNWFSPSERISLGCWLQCVLRASRRNRQGVKD